MIETSTPILRPRSSLGRRIGLLMLPLVLVPVILIGGTGYLRSRAILENQARTQLTTSTTSQVTQLLEWAELREQALQLGSQRATLREPLSHLIHDDLTGAEQDELRAEVTPLLEDLRSGGGQVLFSHIFVLDPAAGVIVASSNPEWVNQNLEGEIANQLAMEDTLTRPLYADPLLTPETLSLVSSAPMRTGMMDEIDAVLVGVNLETRVGTLIENLELFSEQRGVFLEETGATYLAVGPDIVASLPRYSTAPETIAGSDHAVFGLIDESTEGTIQYENQEGVPVLGAYEWVPEMNMGVISEVPTETIFAELNSLFPFIITLVVVTGFLTVIVAVFATSRMLRPLAQLAEFAQRIARGDWEYRVPEERDDEIGVVGQALNSMAEELQESYQTLEQRVEERTRQVRTASQVARAVTSIPNLEDLLRQAVNLIRDRFEYYYVSIFLLDADGRIAELRQATGEAGEALIARAHQLEVGSDSIVGWVTANNEPRVASDVSEDPVHFRNEFLPETRAEAAVPLQVGGTVLGALDVQSKDVGGFSEQDLEILQTLADQLSAAIQNARLAETSMAAAERARMISQVTGQMSGLMDVDQVLNTAAQSLHRALGDSEIMIKLTAAGDTDGQEE